MTSRLNSEDIYHIFSTAPRIYIAAPESELQRFVMEKVEEKDEFVDRVTPVLKDKIVSIISTRACGM